MANDWDILDREVIYQNFSGLIRSMTPLGGGLVREYADTLAATTGNIELGVSYNCAVDPATGVWAGRDIADACWVEKWNDTGAIKQFYTAAAAAAGVVPVWVLAFQIGPGGITAPSAVNTKAFLALPTGRAVQNTAAQAAAAIAQGIASTYIATPAAAITVTLAAPTGDGERRRIAFGQATTVTWAVTAPATAFAIPKTVFAAGESIELVYNSVAGSPVNSNATTWYIY